MGEKAIWLNIAWVCSHIFTSHKVSEWKYSTRDRFSFGWWYVARLPILLPVEESTASLPLLSVMKTYALFGLIKATSAFQLEHMPQLLYTACPVAGL